MTLMISLEALILNLNTIAKVFTGIMGAYTIGKNVI
jgi:hypothetical protein